MRGGNTAQQRIRQDRAGQGTTASQYNSRVYWGRAGQGRAGQGRAGQGRAGQGRAGQGRAGQGRAGQGRAGQGRAGQGRAGQGRAGQGVAEACQCNTIGQNSACCKTCSLGISRSEQAWPAAQQTTQVLRWIMHRFEPKDTPVQDCISKLMPALGMAQCIFNKGAGGV